MANSTIDVAHNYGASLSRRELALLTRWERERRLILTIAELKKEVGARAADTVSNLVRKHALQRVRRGTYLVRPLRRVGTPGSSTTAVAVEALLHDQPHYLGGLWALSFHRFTLQRYESVLDAFTTRRLPSRRLGAARVRFHVQPPSAFQYGIASQLMEGISIRVSDRERTVLDAMDRPRVFYGIDRAVDLLKEQLDALEVTNLIAWAVRGSKPTTCQRLGVLLERKGVSARALSKLHARARETRSELSMKPDAPRSGRWNRDWNVFENDQ